MKMLGWWGSRQHRAPGAAEQEPEPRRSKAGAAQAHQQHAAAARSAR